MDIYSVANMMKIEHKTIFDLNLRVTFYARVSSTTDSQENSIENQIAFFEDMIKKNDNWIYTGCYVDRIRGESANNREQFMQMIEDGKAGKFDLILTKEVSRFARNTIDSLTYTRDLLRSGVGVLFQNDNICTIEMDSELRLTIMSSIAADEVRKLSERVKFGHKKAIENGHVLGNDRIFGYHKENCKLTIIEEEAEMVRLIYQLYSTGEYSVKKIESILYDKGYRGRAGTRIHHNTISGIIQNPKYKGYFCGNKVKIVDYRTKEQRYLPEEEWVMFKDETGEIVPAIVDEDLWQKCNDIFKERSEIVKNKGHSLKNKSVLTGLIYCTVHNKPYWQNCYSNSKSKGQPVYQWICSERRRFGASTCPSVPLMEADINTILAEVINKLSVNTDEYVDSFMEIYDASNTDKQNQINLAELHKSLDFETSKRDKLLELYTESVIRKNEFSERNDKINQRINSLREQIQEIESVQRNVSDYAKELHNTKNIIKQLCSQEITPQSPQFSSLVKLLIKRINVTPVDKNNINMEVILKTGQSDKFSLRRKDNHCRSGMMVKKMVESYEQGANK